MEDKQYNELMEQMILIKNKLITIEGILKFAFIGSINRDQIMETLKNIQSQSKNKPQKTTLKEQVQATDEIKVELKKVK